MDGYLILILLIIVVVAGTAWNFFGIRIRQKLRDKGREGGFALDDKMKNSDASKLGAFLTVNDAQAAAPIITSVIEKTKGVTPLGDGQWNLRYVTPDDLKITWTLDESGRGTLLIAEAHETFGQLTGAGAWNKLLKTIAKELEAARVSFEFQEGTLVKTDQVNQTKDFIWVR